MNKTFLMGNVGRVPDIKESQNGMKIAKFSLAVPRGFKKDGETETDWINIIAFDKKAAFVEKYVTKGTKLIIEGHIATGSYTNKDGNKVYTFDVVADSIEFAQSKKDSEKVDTTPEDDGFMNVEDTDDMELPFQ